MIEETCRCSLSELPSDNFPLALQIVLFMGAGRLDTASSILFVHFLPSGHGQIPVLRYLFRLSITYTPPILAWWLIIQGFRVLHRWGGLGGLMRGVGKIAAVSIVIGIENILYPRSSQCKNEKNLQSTCPEARS